MRDLDVIASSMLSRPFEINYALETTIGEGLYLVSILYPSTSIIVSTEKRNLSKAICSLSLITTTTLSTLP